MLKVAFQKGLSPPKNHQKGRKLRQRASKTSRSLAWALGLTLLASLAVVNGTSYTVSHIAEIEASNSPVLTDGTFRFLGSLKPDGTSLPGVFMHISKTSARSSSGVNYQLFDSV